MTSYDEIWETFLLKCKVDDIDLPQESPMIYKRIQVAVKDYNIRTRDALVCDDATETVDRNLTDDELILVAEFLRLAFLKNSLTYFSTLWQPFDKDVGLKNYSAQLKSQEKMVEEQKQHIDRLIISMTDDFM